MSAPKKLLPKAFVRQTTKVELVKLPKPKGEEDGRGKGRRTGGRGADLPAHALGELYVTFHDLASRLQVGEDAQGRFNRYHGLHLERSPSASAAELGEVAHTLREQAAEGAYALEHSGRLVPNRAWPLQKDEATTGFLAGLRVLRPTAEAGARGYDKRFDLGHTQGHIKARRTPEEKLVEWAANETLVSFEDRERYLRARAAIERQKQERFVNRINNGREMVLEARVPPGRLELHYECPYHFHPFHLGQSRPTDAWGLGLNPSDYRVTRGAYYGSEEVVGGFSVLLSDARRIRINAVPQATHFVGRWTAIYLRVTMWYVLMIYNLNPWALVDRLPFDPPFSFSETYLNAVNDDAMANWLGGTKRVGLALKQDRALEFFSPFMAQILFLREDGLWTARATTLRAGEMAAVVDIEYPTRRDTFYVWRAGDLVRNSLIGYGPLYIPSHLSDGLAVTGMGPYGTAWRLPGGASFNSFSPFGGLPGG